MSLDPAELIGRVVRSLMAASAQILAVRQFVIAARNQ